MDVCGWNCKTLLVNVMLPSEYITCINEHAHSASLERRRPLWKQRCHCRKCHSLYTENQTRVRSSKFLKHIMLLPYSSPHQNITRWQQGVICRGGREDMSWSLNFEVWPGMAYCVLMCYGYSISSPSLSLPTNTTVNGNDHTNPHFFSVTETSVNVHLDICRTYYIVQYSITTTTCGTISESMVSSITLRSRRPAVGG